MTIKQITPDSAKSNPILYGLDDRPPPLSAIVLAMQHVLTMFGATVAVPLMLGPQMGMSTPEIATLISSVMLCSGFATLIQVTFGSRLPIIQGVSFSFLAAFGGIIAAVQLEDGSPAEMMQYIAGAVIVGAIVEIFIGFSGLMEVVRKLLSPVVIGPVIMLIGLALYGAGAPLAGAYWPISILTMVLIVVFSYVLARRFRFFRMFPILLAILISLGLCGLLSYTGIFSGSTIVDGQEIKAHPAYVSLSHVGAASWLRISPNELVFPWGMPKFHVGFAIAVLAGYLASMIESYGDYHACSQMAGGGNPTGKQLSRGIGCEGIGCLLTGLLGGFSSTSYSENIGLVGITKVGSRFVVQIAAVLLILLGVFGKFGAVAAAIPSPIVGGLYCTLFGLISAIGIRELANADLSVDRNLFIAGFALFMGLSVPAYFNGDSGAQALEYIGQYSDGLRDIVSAIGKTGMAVAAVIGLILDNTLPATRKERGLDD